MDLRASEATNLIYALFWIDGDVADWAPTPTRIGLLTLEIGGSTWTYDWIHVRSGLKVPIEIGNILRPSEVSGSFATALNSAGWDAVTLTLTIHDVCGQTLTETATGTSPASTATVTPVP